MERDWERWPVPEGKGMRWRGGEGGKRVWMSERWRGVEKCSGGC